MPRTIRLLSLLAGSAVFLSVLCIPAAVAQTVETLTAEFQASGDISVGPDGLVYVADFGSTLTGAGGPNVYRVTPQSDVAVFASGFLGASGNEFGADGALYQSDVGRRRAVRIAPDGSQEVIATGLMTPVGITPTPDENVYVTECGADAVTRIAPDGAKERIAQGPPLDCPNGLTVGPDGHLYAVNFNDSKMLRIALPGGEVSEFAEIPGGGNGHVTRANGRLYAASFRGRKIYEVTLDGNVRVLAGTGEAGNDDGPADAATFFRPNGIAASLTGDTLFVNTTTEVVDPGSPSLHPNVVRMITGVLATVGVEGPEGEQRGVRLLPPTPTRRRTACMSPTPSTRRATSASPSMTRWDARFTTAKEGHLEPAGRHELLLRSLRLPSGMYLLRFEASPSAGERFAATRTLPVVR